MEVNVHEAKTNFSKLLQRVILGDEIIIAKAGVPVAKLVRYVTKRGKRPLGFYAGEIWMADDFDAPLPDDILAGFYGEAFPIASLSRGACERKNARRHEVSAGYNCFCLASEEPEKLNRRALEILEDEGRRCFFLPSRRGK